METSKLVWSIHPLKENLLKSVFLILFLMILYVVTLLVVQNIIIATVLMFFVLLHQKNYLFKTTYTLYSDTVRISLLAFNHKKKLSDFKRYYIGADAILLSPFTFKTRLNRYRGIYLPFPPELKEQIERIVSIHLECGSEG